MLLLRFVDPSVFSCRPFFVLEDRPFDAGHIAFGVAVRKELAENSAFCCQKKFLSGQSEMLQRSSRSMEEYA